MNDLVIRDALIVDGSGSEPATGDVAVRDGAITAVGEHGLTGKQLVDGSGLVLAPGIVDIHTHYDAQLTWDASASPSPQMGGDYRGSRKLWFWIGTLPPGSSWSHP